MKSPINYEPTSLIKTKVNEKTEVIQPIFQANTVNHESLNEEMQWLQSLIEMRCKELFLEDDLALDIVHEILSLQNLMMNPLFYYHQFICTYNYRQSDFGFGYCFGSLSIHAEDICTDRRKQ
jgi:hypothetical protein